MALPRGARPHVVVTGMYGIGDCIHQRAIMRELMKTRDVYLETYYAAMYHDLVADGLKLITKSGPVPRIRDGNKLDAPGRIPLGAGRMKLTYRAESIKAAGSILAAQFASCGLKMPERPDFSMPVPEAWRERARAAIAGFNPDNKPLLVYRPIVLNKVWEAPSRAPDPAAYAALFASIRDKYFVVSVADLKQREWIVGPEQDADLKLHKGELDFEGLSGLFAEASLVFACPGFAPVLAQAVGTPNIIIYGGNETAATTNSVGAHLAPTLFVEPDHPCACHDKTHACDKRITLPPALKRVKEFAEQHGQRRMRTLIFATTYVNSPESAALLDRWIDINTTLNRDCDLLLVDSNSPQLSAVKRLGEFELYSADASARRSIHRFPDNIGHLARRGRDGWGRAFCFGIEAAIAGGYDYVAHIEGDSLFRLQVKPIFDRMWHDSVHIASIPVNGTKRQETGWVETGLMFMSVAHVKLIDLVGKYDWPRGNKPYPNSPEKVVFDILGRDLTMLPFKGLRDDRNELTAQSVTTLDWVTHCRSEEIYDAFAAAAKIGTDYDEEFFAMHGDWRADYRAIAEILAGWLQFDSAADFGCGNGYILQTLALHGKRVVGLDGSPKVLAHFPDARIMDVTRPIDIGQHDLVICTEVAEHIEAQYADVLTDSLCRAARNTIFFSAAKAGRGGHLHVNEQEASYWIRKFKDRGFALDLETTKDIRWQLANRTNATWWFVTNSLVFRRVPDAT